MPPDSWSTFNDFMEHGTIDRFTKLVARYEVFRRIIELPGDIVECGVFKGTGVLYFARLLEIFAPRSQRKVVGFDTFTGFPESTSLAHDRQAGEEFCRESESTGISAETILAQAEALGLGHRVELVDGDATITIPRYVEENPGSRISLLNLDFDVYDPTRVALTSLYPRVVTGGMVVFDEYAISRWGESQAVDEYFEGQGIVFKSFPWAMSPTAYFVKE